MLCADTISQTDERCTIQVPTGSVVHLVETPNFVAADSATFLGWNGACSGTATDCTFTMNGPEGVGVAYSLGS